MLINQTIGSRRNRRHIDSTSKLLSYDTNLLNERKLRSSTENKSQKSKKILIKKERKKTNILILKYEFIITI